MFTVRITPSSGLSATFSPSFGGEETDLFFGHEAEFRMAFGNGSVERGEFAAALIATHRDEKFVRKIDTGFLGRTGLYELLTVSTAFKEKVTQAPSIDSLRRQAVADGMRPLRLAGALRVAEGITTLEEVLTATPPLD